MRRNQFVKKQVVTRSPGRDGAHQLEGLEVLVVMGNRQYSADQRCEVVKLLQKSV